MLSRYRRSRVRARKTATLRCEALEDRRVLATFTVNDLGDTNDANPGDGVAEDAAGNTTLRAAIEEANALAGADDINFSVAGVVNLPLGELSVSSDLSVDGANSVTVDAGGTSRVMNVNSGTVTLSNLTLNNGSATQGGGVISAGDLTLSGATVSNSTAMQFGGGVFSSGTLALTNNSVVTGNSVGTTNTAFGGGVVSYQGTLTIDNSTVSNNSSSQYGGGIFGLQGSVEITNNSVIADNAVSNSVGAYASGGGISVANGMYVPNNAGAAPFSLTITDSTVSGNSLYGTNFPYGAGVYSFGYGTVSIANTNITGNMNTGGGGARGGAGFNWPAGALGPGTLTVNINDSVIENNISFEESGGFGLRATSLANPVVMNISGSSLSNNTAYGAGGAGFLWSAGADPNSAIVSIQDSTVSGNYSAQTGGGLEFNNANVTISDSTIDGNTTLLNGGGVYLGGSALDDYGYTPPRIVFERTTISNNYAYVEGGGSYAYDFDVVFDNSTISGNTASVYGGGSYHRVYDIYAASPYETTTEFNSSTITNNYSAIGGGAYATTYTTLRATNSIFAGNTAGTGPDVRATQTPDFAYSLVGDSTDSTLAPGNPDANGNIIGDAATPIDPMLGALADNGGPTLTHMPMAGSPVLDTGDPAVFGGVDQRSYTRVEDDDAVPGARIDMGSVERSGTPVDSVDCDFDGDLDCDGDDINMLTAETAAGTNDPAFDLNNDMLVDAADIGEWLTLAGAMNLMSGNPYAVGDANLDGVVDGQDFIAWNANKFTNITLWTGGNFNGDAVTDGQDFILWNLNKFTAQGPLTDPGPGAELDLRDAASQGRAEGKRQRLARQERHDLVTPLVAPLELETGEISDLAQVGAASHLSADFMGPMSVDQVLSAYQAQRDRVSLASFQGQGDTEEDRTTSKDKMQANVDLVLAEL